jgi:phytoene synthase
MPDALAEFVRRHDPDRFLTALFAPAEKRGALLALYAFNHELARAREVVSEPPLALIRLQWWREVVEGAPRRHEVAEPLSAAIASGALARADLLALIDAREVEADRSIPTLDAWRAYLIGSAGGLSVAAARLLGATEPEHARPFGAVYGGAGVLRSVTILARQGRCLLPEDVLARHDLSPEHVTASPGSALASGVISTLAVELRALLPRRVPRAVRGKALTAVLPAVLARRDLRRLGSPPGPRGLGDRVAVLTAAITGRV